MHHYESNGVAFNFNGDFSGDVEIIVGYGEHFAVPFEAIKAFAGEYMRRELVSRLEEIDGNELLDRLLGLLPGDNRE